MSLLVPVRLIHRASRPNRILHGFYPAFAGFQWFTGGHKRDLGFRVQGECSASKALNLRFDSFGLPEGSCIVLHRGVGTLTRAYDVSS